MSTWIKLFEEWFQYFVESVPPGVMAVLKAKRVQPGTRKMYIIN